MHIGSVYNIGAREWKRNEGCLTEFICYNYYMSPAEFRVDPIIPLAYNMAAGSARYALFLGAGVSKDAGVPSGTDILIKTLRLIYQMERGGAAVPSDADIRHYYNERFSNCTYSDIMSALLPSNEEQRTYLADMFADSAPGPAHRAVAQLVKNGLVRFIITTNFDNLLERALDEAGLTGFYTVFSEDEPRFSKPWTQETGCRIYKTHGTIEKGKIRNTRKDLAALPRSLARDAADIIERHGLIVLGYAANEDDRAVTALLQNRRFTGYSLYWAAYRGEMSEYARDIVKRQDGIVLRINSAAEFLADLLARIEIARAHSEQSRSAVYQARFKNLFLSPAPDVEILYAIDSEREKIIRRVNSRLESVSGNYPELWPVFTELFDFCSNYLLLTEQIVRYRTRDFKHIIKIFEPLSRTATDAGFGKAGVRQYLCFCLMEIIGAIIIEHGKFALLAELLRVRRLNFTRDGLESIMEWELQPEFIHSRPGRGPDEAKPITVMFQYLLELVSAPGFPLEFDVKNRLLETDLMFLAYSVKFPLKGSAPVWFARSPVYCGAGSPDLFKRIKFDPELADFIGREFLGSDAADLLRTLSRAKAIIHTDFAAWYQRSRSAEQTLSEF